MAKQNILIVDADPESVKVLEVSLKKAGYSVTKSPDGQEALEMIGFSAPDLIISDTKMPNLDGFGLCTKLKENEETEHIPFIFLTADKSIENKIRGLELGVEDYLNKPIFIREILVRVNLALQRREKERLENRTAGTKSKFSGSLQDMGVVDLLQTIDLGHKSGVIHLEKSDDTGDIFFKDGQVIDAETDTRKGADAVYRMLVWSEGTFEIEFKSIKRGQTIELSTQGLLMEGMRQLDEWGRLQEQLPPLTAIFDVDEDVLADRLGEIPDEVNAILKHFDGRSPLMEVVDRAGLGDLEALTVISKLYFEGLILEVPPRPTIPAPAETEAILSDESLVSRPAPPHVPSRITDDAIGPHLSVAADPLGFVHALTQSAPPPAAPSDEDEVKQKQSIEMATPVAHSMPIGKITPQKIVARIDSTNSKDRYRTTLGLDATDAKKKPSSTMEREDLPTDPRDPHTLTSRELPDRSDIAAVIDAEIPLPIQDGDAVSEDSTSIETSGFFEGDAYKASFNARPSYEPPPTEPDRVTEIMEDSAPKVSGPPDEYDDEDDEDDWGDEHEDEPEVPTNAKPLIAILVLLLLGALVGVYWFATEDEPIDTAASPKKEASQSKEATSATLVANDPVEDEGKDEIVDLNKPVDTLAPTPDKSSDSAGEKQSASPDETPSKHPESISESSAPMSAVAETETPKAVDDTSGTPAKAAEVSKLLSDAKKAGKRKKLTLLEQVIAIDPTNDEALSMLAIQLLERKQTRDQAFDYANRATAANPDNATAWLAVGYIQQLNGDNDAAKQAYQKCAACSGPLQYVRECRRLQ